MWLWIVGAFCAGFACGLAWVAVIIAWLYPLGRWAGVRWFGWTMFTRWLPRRRNTAFAVPRRPKGSGPRKPI